MNKILKNILIFLIFIIMFLFKENIYSLFKTKDYNFNYLKENELDYYKNEYLKLLEENNLKNDFESDYIFTKIIYRNTYDFYNKLIVYKGKNYDIKKDSAVVTDNSLVGVVSKVNKNSSEVILLYNDKFKLSVKINDTYGILECKNNELFINNIVSESNIKIGDIVYTSGLTSIRENIPVAYVEAINISKDELTKIVKVKEISNLKDMKYLMILNNKESNDEL